MKNRIFTISFVGFFAFASMSGLFGDEVRLTDGNVVSGAIKSISNDYIIIEVDGKFFNIDRARVSGAQFGDGSVLGVGGNAVSMSTPVSSLSTSSEPKAPLVWLPFNENTSNNGKEPVKIEKEGNLAYADAPNGGVASAVYSAGFGSVVKITPTPRLTTLNRFSVSFWFIPQDSRRTQYLVSKWTSSQNETGTAVGVFAISYAQDGSVVIYLVDSYGKYHAFGARDLIDMKAQWNHFALTFGQGEMKIYLNGEAKRVYETPFDLAQNDVSPIVLLSAPRNRSDYSQYNYVGGFDDFRLWDEVIDVTEIKRIYGEMSLDNPAE